MRNKVVQYLWIAVGCLISSSAINLFLVPHELLSGGISGIAMISYYLFGLPIGTQIFIFNIPLLYAAYRLLGKKYLVDIIYGAALFSIFVDATKFMTAMPAVDDPLLAAIYGGVFSGIGYGIVFRVGGSSGGLDILAAIMKKYYSVNMGFFNFAVNCVIMAGAAALFGVKPAMLTLISMFVTSTLTDKVIAGLNHKKTVLIISPKTVELAAGIIKEIGRGVTFIKSEGAFTRQRRDMIFVVVSMTQIAKIKLIVGAVDPYAFMIVQDANEVMGRGFTLPGNKTEQ